jgi:hypothetical protein
MNHPLRESVAAQIMKAFPDAFHRHRLSGEECLELRDFLGTVPEEIFAEVLPQVLIDALQTGSRFDLRHLLEFVAPLDQKIPLDADCLRRVFSETQLEEAIRTDEEAQMARLSRLRTLSPLQWDAVGAWRSMIEEADEIR